MLASAGPSNKAQEPTSGRRFPQCVEEDFGGLRTRDAITAVEHEERDASRAEAAREVDVGVDRISVAVLAQRRRGFVAIEADIRRKINQ